MDFKNLVAKLKDQGLDLAEDAAELVVDATLDWLVEEALKSENKYDDLLIAIVPVIKPLLKTYIDKIDGKEG